MSIMDYRRESLSWTAHAEREEDNAAAWERMAAEALTETRAANARRYAAICREAAVKAYQRAQAADEAALRLALATVAQEAAVQVWLGQEGWCEAAEAVAAKIAA
jgi:hypothetical protein